MIPSCFEQPETEPQPNWQSMILPLCTRSVFNEKEKSCPADVAGQLFYIEKSLQACKLFQLMINADDVYD